MKHFNRDKFLDLKQCMREEKNTLLLDINKLFVGQVDLFEGVQTLRHLRLLDCVSCNDVRTELLEIISLFSPMAVVLDYYSNRVGLHLTDHLFD